MPADFEIELPEDWEERFPEIEAAAKKHNVDLAREGNRIEVAGETPVGKIAAVINVDGNTAAVEITKKPMLIPKSLIEGEVRKALTRYS
ncbi:MAG: hypothetical protein GF307_03595 [candidate division Zixibacteria bacterium]|nr:hypothetical protein [candidate division Zixibacteria bacterium]